MPLFVFLSGYFFHTCVKKGFKDVFFSRFKRLIVPEIMNSVIIIILFSLISKFQYDSFYQIYNLTKSYWFLICIFTLTIGCYLMFKTRWIGILIGFSLYIGALMYYNILPSYILKDCQVIRMFMIFVLGAIIGGQDKGKQIFIKNRYFYYFIFPLSILLMLTIRYFYGYNLMEYPPLIRVMDGIFCSTIALVVLYGLYWTLQKKNQKIVLYMVEHGKQSLCFYLAHVIIFRPLFMNDIYIFKEISIINVICIFSIYYIFSYYYTYNIKIRLFNQLFLGRY